MIKKVHIIYKTHLDIGFTNLASEVKKRYIQEFIPKTLELAARVNTDGKKRFIWTTGSWLIWSFLREAAPEDALKLEAAIENGDIRWHALPFTTHTELMDEEMFSYALSYSKLLDERFGKKTVAAKMTDVPGHTKGMIKPMYEAGIKYLHLGVNPASATPDVPEIFLWKDGESQILVNYAKEYGREVKLPNHPEILVFAHSGDNCGPPSEEEIYETIKKYHELYPGAEVTASTLDAFSESIEHLKNDLPILEKEIGDTWIHGLGSDPHKTRVFRIFMDSMNRWLEEGKISRDSEIYRSVMDQLIMIPEHTWGMDIKLHFSDYTNYTLADFNRAKEKDLVTNGTPEKYNFIELFSIRNEDKLKAKFQKKYSSMEKSWEEQRNYYKEAMNHLPYDLQEELSERILNRNKKSNIEKSSFCNPNEPMEIGNYTLQLGKHGQIESLTQRGEVKLRGNIGEYSFKATGENEFHHWFKDYMVNLEKNLKWCLPDQGKPGMELIKNPIREPQILKPLIEKVTLMEEEKTVKLLLKFPERENENFILPGAVEIQYDLSSEDGIKIYYKIKDQKAIRLPIEQWIDFQFSHKRENWKMVKMGREMDPFSIVNRGNKNLHAVEKLIGENTIFVNRDSPLVSFQGESILNFNRDRYRENGFSVNVYNNIWGTNFPLWYEQDIESEFKFIWGGIEK